MKNQKAQVEVQMLIRKPVSVVYQAFIDPAITKNFWFTKASGPLALGKTITWEWEMYEVSSQITVNELVENKKISITWGDPATTVDFLFTALNENSTYVIIKNYGFWQIGDELTQAVNDNTGGFTTVLDGLKAYMEHNINLNLIADKFPKEISSH